MLITNQISVDLQLSSSVHELDLTKSFPWIPLPRNKCKTKAHIIYMTPLKPPKHGVCIILYIALDKALAGAIGLNGSI